MQSQDYERCVACSKPLLDIGEELVCPGCGAVQEKSVVQVSGVAEGKLPLFGAQPLGSFMGSREMTSAERRSRVSGDHTRYEKMKLLSDHAAREGSEADCGRLIERVGERLFLPRVVILQAATVAKKTMAAPHPGRRRTIAAVSAYALVAACKIEGVTSVSIREILAAYADLGKKVRSSAIFHLMLESGEKARVRRPEDYLPRVVAKLSMNKRLRGRLERDAAQGQPYFNRLRSQALDVLRECDSTVLSGKRPCSLAASAVYAAEAILAHRESRRLRMTQRECAACGDSAEYTVREQYTSVFTPVVARLTAAGPQNPGPRTPR